MNSNTKGKEDIHKTKTVKHNHSANQSGGVRDH
jgi:hypothetical protein